MPSEYPTSLADKVPDAPDGYIRRKRMIAEIGTGTGYTKEFRLLGSFSMEPTIIEVKRAVDAGDVEEREFIERIHKELLQECLARCSSRRAKLAKLSPYLEALRQYHARRVAYFVLNKWNNQVLDVGPSGQLLNGGHRLRAAIYMGWEEVWIEVKKPA